jgi:hypothetical protein
MLAMRPDCERCGADLPADAPGAFICSLESTYCSECADDLDERCPDCGGRMRFQDLAAAERRFQS